MKYCKCSTQKPETKIWRKHALVLFDFEYESVAVFSCLFNFENFEVADLDGVFDVWVFAGGLVEAFDFYDSDFFH